MKITRTSWLAFAFAMLLVGGAFAYAGSYGYGTSSISLQTSNATVVSGGSVNTTYRVSLASGSTWGTTVSVTDSAALSSHGITATLSDPTGDPPFSGTLSISTSPTTALGTYNISLAATGDDPSTNPVTFTLTVASQATTTQSSISTTIPQNNNAQTMSLIANSTRAVNASAASNISVSGDGITIRAALAKGTYADVNGIMLQNYNFSLLLLNASNTGASPSNYTSTKLAFAFAINGKISQTAKFVSITGSTMPVTTYVYGNVSNWTSWTFIGGNYTNGAYYGGRYVFSNIWQHPNSTAMINTQFFAAVPWVLLRPAAMHPATTIPTTIPAAANNTTTAPSPSPAAYNNPGAQGEEYLAAIVIIVIVAAAAYYVLHKRKK